MTIQTVIYWMGALSVALLVAHYLRSRQRGADLADLTRSLQRAAIAERRVDRIRTESRHPDALALVSAINNVLAKAAASGGQRGSEDDLRLFRIVCDRVRETVLIHSDTIIYANPHLAALLGTGLDALIGRRLSELVTPGEAEFVSETMRRRLAGERAPERFEIDLPTSQGGTVRLEMATAPIDYGLGTALLATGIEVIPVQPVQGTRPVPAPVVEAAEGVAPAPLDVAPVGLPAPVAMGYADSMRDVLESLAEAILTTDVGGRIDYANRAAGSLLGVDPDRLLGRRLRDVVELVDETEGKPLPDPVQKALETDSTVNLGREVLMRVAATGAERSVEVSAAPIRRSAGSSIPAPGCVLFVHDVTELRGMTRRISYQATHDALTGLVNRQEFVKRLGKALDAAQKGDAAYVMCYVDLDRFKTVNDSSGHLAGDGLLREVARIMSSLVRDSDTVARIGGDEFALLLPNCPLEKARKITADLSRRVEEFRYVWKDRVYSIGASCGIVELNRDSGDVEATLAAADSACYVAKRKGNGTTAIYSERDEVEARRSGEMQWLQMLQTAIRDDQFRLYTQPIVSVDGSDRGDGPAMEVLVRLGSARGVDILPADFLRAAERYRMMSLIDRWVVQASLVALRRGAIKLPARRCLAINISSQTLADEQFLGYVVECFDSTGVDPSRICFELSESVVVANIENAQRFVNVLHGLGCRFALDDFGSNLGAFSNLKDLSVDYLKIDGSFIRNLARDNVNQAMVAAMIKLARTLDLKVIAEHVEDRAAVEAVKRMGVDYMQGFAMGEPRPLLTAAAA